MAGKKAIVIGRSKIVGTPAAAMLKSHDASALVLHSKTIDIHKEVWILKPFIMRYYFLSF